MSQEKELESVDIRRKKIKKTTVFICNWHGCLCRDEEYNSGWPWFKNGEAAGECSYERVTGGSLWWWKYCSWLYQSQHPGCDIVLTVLEDVTTEENWI